MIQNKKIKIMSKNLNNIVEEFIQKINILKEQLNNINIQSKYEMNLVQTIYQDDFKYLNMCEKSIEKITESIQLIDLVLNDEEQLKICYELMLENINEIFTICKDRKIILARQKELNSEEMKRIENKIKNDFKNCNDEHVIISDDREEKIKEVKNTKNYR